MNPPRSFAPLMACLPLVFGCSSAEPDSGAALDAGSPRAEAGPDAGASVQQIPPTTSAADIEAWLARGDYQAWHCQSASSAGTGVSPHGAHRICSNDALSGFTGQGEYPVGAANVKELYDSVGGKVIGHAIELHVSAGTTGASWFWYEQSGGNEVANGTNVSLCVGCHGLAGSDSKHPGHDFVYSQVR